MSETTLPKPRAPTPAPLAPAEPALPNRRVLPPVGLAPLLFVGAVWGAAFLFLRIAAPEVGPVWAAELRLAIGAAVLLALFGRRTLVAVRGRMRSFLVVGALFSAVPFT